LVSRGIPERAVRRPARHAGDTATDVQLEQMFRDTAIRAATAADANQLTLAVSTA
jgi:hypothetical protein